MEGFIEAYQSADVVRRWQDVQEHELRGKRPLLALASLLVVACLTVIIWKRKARESESVLWPVLLIYAVSYLSAYYYVFLCLLVLLFFRRTEPRAGFIPLCLLLVLNVVALVTDAFKPSPIVFFTLINLYLFACLAALLGFELRASFKPAAPSDVASGPAKRRRKR